MLHHPQRGIHRLAGARFDCMADVAIQLVYSTVRFHTHMVFGHAVSSDQPGGSIVAMPRVDLHGDIVGHAAQGAWPAFPHRVSGAM